MTKRILALFLVCVLAIPIFAIPASATTTESYLESISSNLYDLTYNYVKLIRGGVSDIFNVLSQFKTNVLKYLEDWDDVVFTDFWGRFGTLWLQFWNGNENLDIPGLLPTLTNLYNGLVTVINNLRTNVVNIFDYLVDLFYTVQSGFEDVFTWFSDLYNLITDLVSGDSDKAPDDSLTEDNQNVKDNQQILDDFTRPSYDDIDIDLNAQLPASHNVLLQFFFGAFFDSQYIYIVFFLAFSMSLISFVVFGKR